MRRSFPQPKLLAVDLDGTLLDPRGEPHPRDLRALRTLSESGTAVSIVTGRLYSGTRPTAEALGLVGPVACVDGSQMVSTVTHSTIMHHGIKGAHALKLRECLVRSGTATFLFARDAIVHDGAGDEFIEYVTTWSTDIRRAHRVSEHAFWEDEEGVTAVVAVGALAQIEVAVEHIEHELGLHAQVASFPIRRIAGAWGLVVRAQGGNKGSALEWLASHYECSLSETVCVGDWLNDLPMFHVAGRSFAMGQAPEEVKRAATDVLDQTYEIGGGIAWIVDAIFGVKGG